MKNKVVLLVIFSILISSLALNFVLYRYNDSLESELQNKVQNFNNVEKDNLATNDSLKKYSRIIKNYVNDCNFEINGKEINSSELVSILNKQFILNNQLQDSIVKHTDSLRRSNAIIAKVKEDYGVNYSIINFSNGFSIRKDYPTKLDSALVLFPHFKNNLRMSEDGKNWIIKGSNK